MTSLYVSYITLKLDLVDDLASGVFLHAQYSHRRIDRLCFPSWVGHAIYPPIQAYPDVWVIRQDHVSHLAYSWR